MVRFRKNFSRYRDAIYRDRFQRRMPNSRSSFGVSGSGTSGNEWTGQGYMENVAYNHTINMMHARVLEVYIHFTLMYTADHIFSVLLIKDMINKYGKLTTPFKAATGTKPSV